MSASYKDKATGTTDGWIHELARAETHAEADMLLQLGNSFDPQRMVEESTIQVLEELRSKFQDYAKAFNDYSAGGARFQEVKIYQLAESAADFMVYRSQVKLLITNAAHGLIQLSYSQNARGAGAVAVDGRSMEQKQVGQTQELLAQVGPFREVYWSFHGERVNTDQLARYYFTEFVRLSRDPGRSRASNQVLLDQIKALLEEKGLRL